MRTSNFLFGGLLAALLAAPLSVAAQTGPAEQPPESFEGGRYVDSDGCAFVRAVIGGETEWAPQLTRSREPLCDETPSNAPASGGESLPAAADVEMAPEGAPVRQARAVSDPAPVRTVTSTPSGDAHRSIVSRNSEQRGAQTVLVTTVGAASGQGERVSLATLCARLAATGARYVVRRTGEPVACPSATRNRGTLVVRVRGEGPAEPTGPGYPTEAEQAAPSRNMVAAGDVPEICKAHSPRVQRILTETTEVNCFPSESAGSPLGRVASTTDRQAPRPRGRPVVILKTEPVPDRPKDLFGGGPVPASNPPPELARRYPTPPAGYAPAWTDGRINPQRGFPEVTRYLQVSERVLVTR